MQILLRGLGGFRAQIVSARVKANQSVIYSSKGFNQLGKIRFVLELKLLTYYHAQQSAIDSFAGFV
jgi:hypothetical protein